MKFLMSVAGLVLDLFVKRITRPHNVYTKLAVAALLLSGGAFLSPLWEKALEAYVASSTGCECGESVPSIAAGATFLLLSFLFASLSNRASSDAAETIVNSKSVSAPLTVCSSKIYCYCGSILAISDVDLVITSENTNLHLGSIGGTSVSGRIRRLGASFNSDGTLAVDHIQNDIDQWKAKQPHCGPYGIGVCIPSEPHNAKSRGIKKVIHAIALEKRDSGVNYVDESAVRNIIDFSIKYAIEHQYSSIFVPVFGAGSGGLSGEDAVSITIRALVESIRQANCALDIYVGTYRVSDAANVTSRLLKLR
jgi:O-acetyl-ADP-ribose deacetylase (regulator of RNase III)